MLLDIPDLAKFQEELDDCTACGCGLYLSSLQKVLDKYMVKPPVQDKSEWSGCCC